MARKENARGQPTIWPEYSDESWGGHLRHRHGLDLARDQIAATIGTSAGTVRESWQGLRALAASWARAIPRRRGGVGGPISAGRVLAVAGYSGSLRPS